MTVIAMTRELGCRGTEVATGVASQLRLKLIHSEIVANNVAARLGIEESALLRHIDGSASMFERWLIDRRKLQRYTSEEILQLVQQGNVLIRGWGAATLLRDFPQVISVRVCAPKPFRVQVMMERLGVSNAGTVQQEIESYDAAHARTLRAHFNIEWEDALLYHIILNTDRLPVEACVKAVCQLAEHPKFRDDPAMIHSALADKLLEAKINSALTEHVSFDMAPLGISVSVADGKVTLVGTSRIGSVRDKAEKVARGIAGLREIDNRISVPSHGRGF
jgi:cytidylate kinase